MKMEISYVTKSISNEFAFQIAKCVIHTTKLSQAKVDKKINIQVRKFY